MAGCTMRGDRLNELVKHIEYQHRAYIFAEKSPLKIEIKRKLEALIHEFLCIVPHKQKFSSPATEEVLHRSVISKEDFSASRATLAWTAIANYADNLLTQPWRNEYHEIKTYCGYYKHHVGSGLVGAELMLEAMGYKHTSQYTLVLDGNVDFKRVNMISLDSLIAQVECQILGTIYAEVLKSVQSCSWVDVLKFREQHVCNPELAIPYLSCRSHPRMHEEPYRPHTDNCSLMATYPSPYPYPYLPPGCYNYNYPQPRYVEILSPPQPYPHYYLKPHEQYATSYNSYHHLNPVLKNGYIPSCSVPTAQLIEIGPIEQPATTHRRSSSDHRIDTTDFRKNGDRYQSDVYSRSTTSDEISLSKRYQSDQYSRSTTSDDFPTSKKGVNKVAREDWALVYKDLEERRERDRTEPPPDLEDAMKTFCLDDRHQITTLSDRKTSKFRDYEEKKEEQAANNRLSIYDNSPLPQTVNNKQQTMSREKKPAENSVQKSNKITAADTRKLRVNLSNEDRSASRWNEDKWECKSCTFHNKVSSNICEMCSKSRYTSSEQKPLASLGKECPTCTLINEKGVSKCKACDGSLKDSGIYV